VFVGYCVYFQLFKSLKQTRPGLDRERITLYDHIGIISEVLSVESLRNPAVSLEGAESKTPTGFIRNAIFIGCRSLCREIGIHTPFGLR
jgi:hypothetical protein